jgi:hypothetical protein
MNMTDLTFNAANAVSFERGNAPTQNKSLLSRSRKKRRGAMLIDNSFALLIAVGVLVGIVILFFTVRENLRHTTMATLMTQLAGNTEAAYANFNSYGTGSLVDILDKGGDIPRSARVENSGTVGIESPYGTAITVVGAGTDFIITAVGLSDAACVKVLENTVGNQVDPVQAVSLGGTAQTLPLSKASISTGCAGGSTDVAITY